MCESLSASLCITTFILCHHAHAHAHTHKTTSIIKLIGTKTHYGAITRRSKLFAIFNNNLIENESFVLYFHLIFYCCVLVADVGCGRMCSVAYADAIVVDAISLLGV